MSARSSSWCRASSAGGLAGGPLPLGPLGSAAGRPPQPPPRPRRSLPGREPAPAPPPGGRARRPPRRRGTRGRRPRCSPGRRAGPGASSIRPPISAAPARAVSSSVATASLRSADRAKALGLKRQRLQGPGLPQHRLVPILIVRPAQLIEHALKLTDPEHQPASALPAADRHRGPGR